MLIQEQIMSLGFVILKFLKIVDFFNFFLKVLIIVVNDTWKSNLYFTVKIVVMTFLTF